MNVLLHGKSFPTSMTTMSRTLNVQTKIKTVVRKRRAILYLGARFALRYTHRFIVTVRHPRRRLPILMMTLFKTNIIMSEIIWGPIQSYDDTE
jgi:hypothetical protein